MKIKTVSTVLTTNSAGQVVESRPVREVAGPVQVAGQWVSPVVVEEDPNGIPVRIVTDPVVLNSAGQPVAATPVTGGGVPAWIAALGTEGMRIFGGRMGAFDNTTKKTSQVTAELPVPTFKRVKVIIANAGTSTRAIGGCSIATLPNLSDMNGASATHTPVLFTGSATATVPAAASSTRRSYLISDWVDLVSAERDDGADLPAILLAREFEDTSGSIQWLGNGGSDNYANWATRTDGKRWAMRYNDGNCCAGTGTPANFVSTTARIQSGIAGFVFETANGEQVCTLEGFGDSITEGRGTYINEGWGIPLCDELHDLYPGVHFSWCNLGWSGQTMAQVDNNQADGFAAGLVPDLAIFPNYSPNSTNGNNDISDAEITSMTTSRDNMRTRCDGINVPYVVWTGLPTASSVTGYDFGASDSKRTAYNGATIAHGAANDYEVGDTSTAASGTVDGDGQTQPAVGFMVDGIHPGDSGNVTQAGVLAPKVVQALQAAA
jgi:hypothetical protein